MNVGVFCCSYSLNEGFNMVVDVNHVLHMQRALLGAVSICILLKNFKIPTPINLDIV